MIGLALGILELVTAWKVFVKYGEPGWKGLIPIYGSYVEYSKVWNGTAGVLAAVLYVFSSCAGAEENDPTIMMIAGIAAILYAIVHIRFCIAKSKAFGKGIGMTLLLIFFPFIGNLVLGFGDAEYIGE